MIRLIIISIFLITIVGCRSDVKNAPTQKKQSSGTSTSQQLNISILLDLSDRISPKINTEAQKYDIENIKTVAEYFKINMEKLTAWNAKGKMRVFFSPAPKNDNINSIVDKLKIDCSVLDNKGRKIVYDSIVQLYDRHLNSIYKESITSNSWPGSDIWRFFKDDVSDLCIDKNPSYRNILIILTDGYLYHQQSLFKEGNRFSYITGSSNLNHYRNQNWQNEIDKNDFGIITNRTDLENLEVLVLEIRSDTSNNKIDEDILRYVWKKWLTEMGIKHCETYPFALPTDTKVRIEKFLNENMINK